jgi:hypothetical protein
MQVVFVLFISIDFSIFSLLLSSCAIMAIKVLDRHLFVAKAKEIQSKFFKNALHQFNKTKYEMPYSLPGIFHYNFITHKFGFL